MKNVSKFLMAFMVIVLFSSMGVNAQSVSELQAAIDNSESMTRAGDVDEINLGPYSGLEFDGTLYIRKGQRKRFTNGTLKSKSTYSGPLVTVETGGYLELPSGVVLKGAEGVATENGLVNVTGGELLISGAEIREGNSDLSTNTLIVINDPDDATVSPSNVVTIYYGFIAGYVKLNYYKGKLEVQKPNRLNGILATSPDQTILFSYSDSDVTFQSLTKGNNAHLTLQGVPSGMLNVKAPTGGIAKDNVIAQGYSGTTLYKLTDNTLKHIAYKDEANPDKEWTLYIEDNCVKVKEAVSAFDLQEKIDKAAKGGYTETNPAIITIPEGGYTIDKDIRVPSNCHCVITGGKLMFSKDIAAHSPFYTYQSSSVVLRNITLDCVNHKNVLYDYLFYGSGKVIFESTVSFENNSIDNTVGLYGMFTDAKLEYYVGGTGFKSSNPTIYSYDKCEAKVCGTIESKDVAIAAENATVFIEGADIRSGGDFVIKAENVWFTKESTVASTRDFDGWTALVYAKRLNLLTNVNFPNIGTNTRIIVEQGANMLGNVTLPIIKLFKDAELCLESDLVTPWQLEADWQEFTVGKPIVRGLKNKEQYNNVEFLNIPSGLNPYYDKRDSSAKLIDLQWIIDNSPLDNTDEDDDPVEIPVPCDGLKTEKDISLEGLQALIDGEVKDDCGTVEPIVIPPVCLGCANRPEPVFVLPWYCPGNVTIKPGSIINITNIFINGCDKPSHIYVYGTLVIDINVYIHYYSTYVIHVRPGGRVIYRGHGSGSGGFIYNEGGTVIIEQGEIGGGDGTAIINIGGTVEIHGGTGTGEVPTKIYGGIQNGSATGDGGKIYIYGGEIHGGIVNYGTLVVQGGTIHGGEGIHAIDNHGDAHIDGGEVDGDIYTYTNIYLCGCASVTDLYLKRGVKIYITERLTINIRIHFIVDGDFDTDTPIIIGTGGYVLTDEDIAKIEIKLPQGYSWEYDIDLKAIVIRNTSGINGVIADEAPADIHNMKGIKVGTTDNTDNLPSGTYIVKGKTIQLKK